MVDIDFKTGFYAVQEDGSTIFKEGATALCTGFTPEEIEEWHKKYKDHLIKVYKFDPEFAEETLKAGMDSFDYNDDPIDAADEELSYWGD